MSDFVRYFPLFCRSVAFSYLKKCASRANAQSLSLQCDKPGLLAFLSLII
jgi:hypothetical protein